MPILFYIDDKLLYLLITCLSAKVQVLLYHLFNLLCFHLTETVILVTILFSDMPSALLAQCCCLLTRVCADGVCVCIYVKSAVPFAVHSYCSRGASQYVLVSLLLSPFAYVGMFHSYNFKVHS